MGGGIDVECVIVGSKFVFIGKLVNSLKTLLEFDCLLEMLVGVCITELGSHSMLPFIVA